MTDPGVPPFEVEFPRIAGWARGNTGTPYVWSFESPQPGPHLLLQALTHGNEVCGAIALDRFLREELRPRRGRLTFCFANVAAYARWDPAAPFASRCVDEDFNRLWSSEMLASARTSCELERARELRSIYDCVDHLLDIHSMSEICAPLMLTGTTEKSLGLARHLGSPQHIVRDAGHAAGRRLRDYAFFDDAADPRTALLIECGQHWAASSVDVAIDTALRFIAHFDMLDASRKRAIATTRPSRQRILEITHAITIRTTDFRWLEPVHALQRIRNAGTVLARDGDEELVTPYEDCVLVMPTQRTPKPGETAVRLGRYAS